jgi:anti-sigma B factor antagonist
MIHNRRLSPRKRESVVLTSETGGEHSIVMSIAGDIDAVTAPVVDLEVRRLCRSAAPTLVVDLNGVTFLGAAGLSLLIDAYRQTQLAEIALRLVAPSRIVRLLDITGLAQMFSLHDSVPEALEAANDSPVDEPGRHLAAPLPRSNADARKSVLRSVQR